MKKPRKLLYPLSLIYQGITDIRNFLYDKRILESKSYDLPLIVVGNLNTGGTGKSPMVEYLLSFLTIEYKVATLSRGYKRKSKGFHMVEITDNVSDTGDEPLQFKHKFPEAIVAVDANRREGITKLRKKNPDVILLDDAYQHRKVKAGMNILLTAYDDIYRADPVLPAGNLRESRKGAQRADLVVVTKCPEIISAEEMKSISEELKLHKNQQLYFSKIGYSEKIYGKNGSVVLDKINEKEFVLVTGIANPKPLIKYLKSKNIQLEHLKFPDHHSFSTSEIQGLDKYSKILTTEKDYMRLKDTILSEKLFYLPIQTVILDKENALKSTVQDFINRK